MTILRDKYIQLSPEDFQKVLNGHPQNRVIIPGIQIKIHKNSNVVNFFTLSPDGRSQHKRTAELTSKQIGLLRVWFQRGMKGELPGCISVFHGGSYGVITYRPRVRILLNAKVN